MPIKISYNKKATDKISSNTVLFVDEKFSIDKIRKYFLNNEFLFIKDLLRTSDLKKKNYYA